ncbi:hypothetical protein E2C01_029760 [Portunus trituberculatus]|uniref:Uncharacterized protein n=1 Tax=Portunus trituberculatus TaxID=210409 RepID=A0A5B7ET37_PORTR|nr:hypothetical protein [Portunus trituberculatus]
MQKFGSELSRRSLGTRCVWEALGIKLSAVSFIVQWVDTRSNTSPVAVPCCDWWREQRGWDDSSGDAMVTVVVVND